MKPGTIDLSSCDTEPIHEIGSIQPYGALLAVDEQTMIITHASQNLPVYLYAEAADVIGTPLQNLIGDDACHELLQCQLDPRPPHLISAWYINLTSPDGQRSRIECLPHRSDGKIIIEVLQLDEDHADVWQQDMLRQTILPQLIQPDNLQGLATVCAHLVRQISGFDRVMIYRFADDGHGEVIAEATNRPDSYMGLHYPASDIPEPARRHFTLNLIRAISDINAVPSPILTRKGEIADTASDDTLDLTFSKLRAVAPVHVEYLNSMGVAASMSISLVANGKLWGLVACHHYAPHHLPSSILRYCEMMGAIVSALLQNLENAALLKRSITAERVAFDLEMRARSNPDLHEVVTQYADVLMQQVDANGMIFQVGGKRLEFGKVPDEDISVSGLAGDLQDGVAVSDHLLAVTNLNKQQVELASGAAYLELSEDAEDYLLLLREQYEHEITWAGKPEKHERVGEDGVNRLSPRGSFALWRQERLGRSKPFSHIDREVLRITRRALFALNSLNRERSAVHAQKTAEAAQVQLRTTLLNAVSKGSVGELAGAMAHELTQPLAAVSNYVNACRQEMVNHKIDVPEDVLGLIDRAVDEAARAAQLVRRLRSFLSTGELVHEVSDLNLVIRQAAEIGLVADGNNDDIIIKYAFDEDLPPISIDPVQIGLVILNLVRNSVTAMRKTGGLITLSTFVDAGQVTASVKDTGPGVPAEMCDTLFEPLHESTTSGMGIGLSLGRTIVKAHHGRIWLEPTDMGAEIRFTLPLKQGRND